MASEPSFLGPNFFSRAASSSSDSQQFPSPHPPFPESTMVSSGFASMASSPSTFPLFTAPYTFPCPIPTPIDPNWPPAAHTPIHGDLHHTSFPFFPTSAPVHTTVYPPPPFGFGAPPHGPYHHPFPHYDTPERMSATTYHDTPELRPPLPVSWDPIPLITTSTICGSSSAVHSSADHVPFAAKDATPSAATTSSFFGATSTAAAIQGMLGKTSIIAATPGLFGAASSAASKQDLSSGFTSRAQQAAEDMALRQASAPTQTKEAARDNLAGEIVQIQSRLRQQEYSIQSIQGEVANQSKKVAQIGSSLGMHIHDGNIASQASGFGTQREMQFSEMPQHYGFDNLKRQSVFLADGSEHSFYALPDNYPLKQSTSPMSPSAAEHVDVTSEPFVAAQAAGLAPVHCSQINNTAGSVSLLVPNLQLPMNVQDAPHVFKETPIYDIYEEQDSACLDITSDVRDFPLELQQQDGERACNCPVLKASDSLVTRSSQLSVDYSMSKLRLLWDPGASALLVTPVKNDSSNDRFGTEHVGRLVSSMGNFSFYDKPDLWCQSEHPFMVLLGVFEEIMLDIPPAKPPDSKQVSATQAIQGNSFSLETIPSCQRAANFNFPISILWRTTTSAGDKIFRGPNTAANSQMFLPGISTSDTEHICIFVKLSPWGILSAHHFLDSSMKKGSIFSAGQTFPWNRWYAILLLHHCLWEFSFSSKKRAQWDPGVKISLYSWLDSLTVWSEIDKQLSCTRLPDLAVWPSQSVSSVVCIWDPGIRPSSSLYCWLQSLTTGVAPQQPLFSLQTLEPAISIYVRYPGTMVLQDKYIWMLLFTEEKKGLH